MATPAASPPQKRIDGTAIRMPFGDLTVSEGKMHKWRVNVGDIVRAKDIVAEIETDKALVEIEAPAGGTVIELLAVEGQIVKMGETIGVIR